MHEIAVRAGCRTAALQRRPDRPGRRPAIAEIVARWAGQPHEVVRALIDAANDAGGKDNITVVYVEGEQFAPPAGAGASVEITRRLSTGQSAASARESAASDDVEEPTSKRRQAVRWMLLVLLTIVIVLAVDRSEPLAPLWPRPIGPQRCPTPARSWCSRQSRFRRRCRVPPQEPR